ncbi:MAG: ShlB/FhaC/HecB family hemolysin secretion/activation protein [Deltaproteobacteria bacterium]|nr:ShlB/FhaC/HecB family hemolysin secretion/activation protein [Deltaproteobacteria bacterium]
MPPEILSPPADKDKLSSKDRVFIKKIKLTGNTKFTENDLAGVIEPYENREVGFEELQALRQELTLYYVNRGYISSGVIIPDQKVSDGIVTLKVIEGALVDINVEGNKYFRSSYIKDRLALASKAPVNINNLQRELQLLQQDPRIKRINAELLPGVMAGESNLKVKVEEEKPFKSMFSFSNSQSPSVGAYRGELMLAHTNLSGRGDVLEGRFGLTEGAGDMSFSYTLPINARDTTLEAHYRKSASTVVEETFRRLDIESRAETYGMTLRHPLFKSPEQEFGFALTGEVRRDTTFLLGRPFSFTGSADNVSHVTALRFSQEWVSRSRFEVIALRSNFSFGVDAFNATVNSGSEDGKFVSWTGQVQVVRQLSDTGALMILRTDAQFANDALLPMEKFSVGGMNSVRGYRENQLVRDNGMVSSVEFRLPVIRSGQRGAVLQFAPFADLGRSWNSGKETPNPENISSIGAGVRWAISQRAYFQTYYGRPLRKVSNSGHDLQDEGVHFLYTYQLF